LTIEIELLQGPGTGGQGPARLAARRPPTTGHRSLQESRFALRVRGRKLPIAGYSVVKEHSGDCIPRTPSRGRSWGPENPTPLPRGAPLARLTVAATVSVGPRCPAPFGRPLLVARPVVSRANLSKNWWRIPGSNR
jgi:hypothetical protein